MIAKDEELSQLLPDKLRLACRALVSTYRDCEALGAGPAARALILPAGSSSPGETAEPPGASGRRPG